MKPEEEQNNRVLRLLKRCRLDPSMPGRREQVLAAARAALAATSPEEPTQYWRPLLRFAAAVASTVLLVAIAHFWDARTLARWQLPPALQGTEAVAEIAETDQALAQELLFFPTIRIHDADRMIGNWLKNQELLRELMELEAPGVSNSQDEPPISRQEGSLGNSRLMAQGLPNVQYPIHNFWKSG